MSTIPFQSVPANTLVPRVYIEVDSSQAEQGPSIQPYKILLIGNRTASGTKPEGELVQISDSSQAKQYFGSGSILAQMCEKCRDVNKATELWAVALDDDGAAVDATGTITFGGTISAAGTAYIWIGGRRYEVGVSSTDSAADVATALVAEITADPDAVVTAAVNGTVPEKVDLTAKNACEASNDIDVRYNYYADEELPTGLTVTIVAMSGGTANPDITTAIAALTEDQYNVIAMPYTDSANLTALDNEWDDRFGPIRDNHGVTFLGMRDTYANLASFGSGKNSKNYSVMGMGGPNSPWEWASQIAGWVALAGQQDPARPFQTLTLSTILAPSESERFTWTERNLLLADGIATYNVITGGNVNIERLVTTYKQNSFGADDTSFRDVNTLLTIDYFRYDFARDWLLTYPRNKLADDGTNFAPAQGQVIMTPKTAKGFALTKFKEWEQKGLCEDFEQFKRDLVAVRDESDPNRLNMLLPINVINQLRVTAALLQFRL